MLLYAVLDSMYALISVEAISNILLDCAINANPDSRYSLVLNEPLACNVANALLISCAAAEL
jgi:hypothetical protein